MEYVMNNGFPRQFAFAKSLSGQYLFVCENMAEVAGYDSPAQMIGLRDSDLVWKDWTEFLKREDAHAFKGSILLNHPGESRWVQEPDKVRQILSTKAALRDKENNIVGVIGSAIDVTEHDILKSPGHFDAAGKKFIFSGALAGLTFNKKQMILLQYIMMGYSAAEIANLVHRSKRTIEGHIEHLKHKLQCTSKAEIIRWAVSSGLAHGLDWPGNKGE